MYQLDSAFVKTAHQRSRWQELDVRYLTMDQLFQDYVKVLLVLYHSVTGEQSTLDLDDLPQQWQVPLIQDSVNDWLKVVGDRTLPTTPGLPTPTTRYASYLNAWQAGYHIEPTPRSYHHTNTQSSLERPDLRLTLPEVNGRVAHRRLLATVNDLFHSTDGDDEAFYIRDGHLSGQLSQQNDVGLFDLGQVGNVSFIPITEEILTSMGDTDDLSNKAHLFVEQDLTDKSVILVLGGYIDLTGALLSRVGNRLFSVDIANLPLLERLYESRQRIDLSSLWAHLDQVPQNVGQLSPEQLYQPEVIRAYLTLSQSFLVVLDTPDFFVEQVGLEDDTPLPGVFTTREAPYGLMRTETGLAPSYWCHQEDGLWVLTTPGYRRENWIMHTSAYKRQQSVDDTRWSYRPTSPMRCYLQYVGKESL